MDVNKVNVCVHGFPHIFKMYLIKTSDRLDNWCMEIAETDTYEGSIIGLRTNFAEDNIT